MAARSPPKNFSVLPAGIVDSFKTLSNHFLRDLWIKMGLDSEALRLRQETASDIMTKTLLEMRAEEEVTLAKLVDRIEAHAKDRNRLGKELSLHLTDPDPDLGLIQLERILRHEVRNLEAQKEEQMKEVRRLRKEDEDLCTKMQMEPFYVSLKVIPTPTQMEGLQKHVKDMTTLRAKRLAQFTEAKLTIISLLEQQLQDEPNSSFERLVVCEEDDCFTLSAENLEAVEAYLTRLSQQVEANRQHADGMRKRIFSLMDKLQLDPYEKQRIKEKLGGHTPAELKELKTRLDELETLKCEKMEQFIQATRAELVNFWDLCYYSQSQREKFTPFFSTDYNEGLLEQHEREVESIKKYFDDNEAMFKKVAKRQELWKTMLELDAKQKDPDHLLKAKGKDLLLEEKDRKRVNKLLPKIDEELLGAMASYLQAQGTPFLVGGKPYEDFLEEQKADFWRQQEYERQSKIKQKKETNFHETLYGSKPITPAKRTATLKRKAEQPTPGSSSNRNNDTKRLRGPEMMSTFGSATMRSPFGTVNSRTTTTMINKSKYGLREQPARRKILGENNDSVFMSGARPTPRTMAGMTENWSVSSDNFLKDLPNSALTSTFQKTPESCKKSQRVMNQSSAASTPKFSTRSTPTFKTPSSRVLTPANRSTKKLALSNGRKMPFLI